MIERCRYPDLYVQWFTGNTEWGIEHLYIYIYSTLSRIERFRYTDLHVTESAEQQAVDTTIYMYHRVKEKSGVDTLIYM
jgi:hypothetical protein